MFRQFYASDQHLDFLLSCLAYLQAWKALQSRDFPTSRVATDIDDSLPVAQPSNRQLHRDLVVKLRRVGQNYSLILMWVRSHIRKPSHDTAFFETLYLFASRAMERGFVPEEHEAVLGELTRIFRSRNFSSRAMRRHGRGAHQRRRHRFGGNLPVLGDSGRVSHLPGQFKQYGRSGEGMSECLTMRSPVLSLILPNPLTEEATNQRYVFGAVPRGSRTLRQLHKKDAPTPRRGARAKRSNNKLEAVALRALAARSRQRQEQKDNRDAVLGLCWNVWLHSTSFPLPRCNWFPKRRRRRLGVCAYRPAEVSQDVRVTNDSCGLIG
jgi:hypothetical protein